MVKRPLTPDRLSTGPECPSHPAHRDRACGSAVIFAIPRAALDTLSPTPSPTLLSTQEAKERLREIVEGFFFQRLRIEAATVPALACRNLSGPWRTRSPTANRPHAAD